MSLKIMTIYLMFTAVLFSCAGALEHVLAVPNNVSQPLSSSSWLNATTLHWNSHRPCTTDTPACVSAAQQRLGEMAKQVGAQIVGAVELKDGHLALPGWQTSGQQCDNSAVMVAPGWRISNSGGFCMGGDSNKGFAVALVTPPQQVTGCAELCIFMGHVPHPGHNITGHSEIVRVCGGAEEHCMIAMADWNAKDVSSPWETLIGGTPSLVEPHVDTCCYLLPASEQVPFDHTATNIAGARSVGETAFDYQLTKFPSRDEHKPTSVQLQLPVPQQSHAATYICRQGKCVLDASGLPLDTCQTACENGLETPNGVIFL